MFLIKKSRSADAQCWAVTLCDWKKQPPEFSIQTFLKILQYSQENTIVKFLRTPNFKNICVRLLLNVAKFLRTPFPQNTSGRLLVTLRLVLFVVLSWPPKIWFDRWFFYFSVHGDQQRNNIYVQRCIYKKKNSQKNTSELQDPFLVKECFDNTTEKFFFRKIWE